MIKFLGALAVALMICFDVSAIVVQSASNALSYRNVAKHSRSSAPVTVQKPKEPEHIPVTRYVDLTNQYSADIQLQKTDFVEVTLVDDKSCIWKIKSDQSLLLVDNKVMEGKRIVKFKKISDDKKGNIYMDSIDKYTQKIVANKAVYVYGN